MVRRIIIALILLSVCTIGYAQFGGGNPFPDNILIRNNGTVLEGTGKIIDLRTGLSATFDSLTSTYHWASSGGSGASDLTGLSDVNSATQAAGAILQSNGVTFDSIVIPDCDGDGETLGFTQATRTWTCGDDDTSGSTSLTGLSDVNSATATSGNVLVADGSDFHSVGLSELVHGIETTENISVGTLSPSSSFRGDGDIYATSGIKAMEGLFAEAGFYGAGVEISDNSLSVTSTNVVNKAATFTATTKVIEDIHASFTEAYEGQFMRIISSTPSMTGATAEITEYLSGTELVLSLGTAGGDVLVNATDMWYVVYPHPIFFVGDNGVISASVGVNEDAKFEIHIDEGKGFHGVYIDDKAGADQHQALTIDADTKGFDGIVGHNVFVESSVATTDDSVSVASFEINEDNYTTSTLKFIDINLIGSGTNNDVDVIHVEGLAATGHLMHIGQPNTIEQAYYDNGDGTTVTALTAFTSQGTDMELFQNDDSIIYMANETEEFTFIGISLSTEGNKNITPEYYYCKGDNDWVALPGVTDTTDGLKTSGSISFPNPGDRGLCDEEIDGTAFADTTDRAYIAIKRTRDNWSGDYPIENLLSIGGATYLYMDSYGIKPIGSDGQPYNCTSSEAGMSYYDSTAVALLWCDGATWNEFAETTDITVHNNLSGLQGGTATERYHLSSANNTTLTAFAANSSLTGLTDVNSATAGQGKFLVNDGTSFHSISMSGDATITKAGVIALTTLSVSGQAEDTFASGDFLLFYDATGNDLNKVNYDNLPSGGTSGNNNEVLTDDGAGGIVSESNLTFDGTDLTVANDLYVKGGDADDYLKITTDSNYPELRAIGTNRVYIKTDTENAASGLWIKGNGTGNALFYMEDGSSADYRAYWQLGTTSFELGLYENLTNYIINTMGYDVDFIIESDNEDKLFFVDGGTDDIRMGDSDTNYIQISNTGVLTLAGSASLGSITGLSDVNSATATAGNMLIANGSDFHSVAMSGAGTITKAGVIYLTTVSRSDTKGFKYLESDGIDATDDFTSVWHNSTSTDFILTELWCESDGTVTGMFQVDDGTPADVDSVDLACDSGKDSDNALDGDTTIAVGEELDWATTSVDGTPTDMSAFFSGYYEN